MLKTWSKCWMNQTLISFLTCNLPKYILKMGSMYSNIVSIYIHKLGHLKFEIVDFFYKLTLIWMYLGEKKMSYFQEIFFFF